MTERFETFTVLINRISRNIRKIKNQEMADYNLRSSHISCLYYLYTSGGLTATDLCERCEEDKAAVSRIVAEMENKGLVYKENKEAQVYKAKIYLTEKGNETARFVAKRVKDALSVVGDKIMTEDERRLFYGDILEKLEVMAKEGIPKKGE